MAVSRRTGRGTNFPPALTAVWLLLVLPLLLSTSSSAQMLVQPELGFDAQVHPHDEPLGPGEKGHDVIDVVVTCESPGVLMDPIDILFYFQTRPSVGVEITPETLETDVAFSPEECAASGNGRSIVLEPEFFFTHGFHDPVKIELWAQHQGQTEMVVHWHEPPGVHADWNTFFEQRATIMVDTLISMKGEIQNTGNVPIDVEIIVQDPPRYGRLDHPERVTVTTSRDGKSTQDIHLEYRAERIGQERFAILLRASTAEGPTHKLDPHLARVSFDVVERQSAMVPGMEEPDEGFSAGTYLLLMLAAGAAALLAWRKNHRPADDGHRGAPVDERRPPAPPGPPVAPATTDPTSSGQSAIQRGAFHVKEIRAPER